MHSNIVIVYKVDQYYCVHSRLDNKIDVDFGTSWCPFCSAQRLKFPEAILI